MKQFVKIVGIVLLAVVLLLIGIFFYLQRPSGQRFLTTQVTNYLKRTINQPFSIKKIRYKIPDWVALEGVYFSDNHGDTLLAGQKIYVDIDMMELLKNKVAINEITLQNIKLNIKRTLPDTTFNFTKLLNAFQSKESSTAVSDTATSSPFLYNISTINLQNIGINYRDDISGIEAKTFIKKAKTGFEAIAPKTSTYHLNQLELEESNLTLRLYDPLKKVESSPTVQTDDTLDLAFGTLDFKKINWKITDETSGLVNTVSLGRLRSKGEKLSLANENIHLKSLELFNTTASVKFLKKSQKIVKSTPTNSTANHWRILIDKIVFDQNTIQYQDFNTPFLSKGIDYNNLKINNLKLNSERFYYSPNQISGWIYSSSFNEKSGFQLQNLQTDFAYTHKQMFLKKFLLKTPKSILRDELVLNYKSQDDLIKDIGQTSIKTSLKNSQLAFQDILWLVPNLANTPPFKGNAQEILKFNGLLTGKINNLKITDATFSAFNQTKVRLNGQITGLPNVEKTALNLNVSEIGLTKKDLMRMVPSEMIPQSIDLPQKIALTGKIDGKINDLNLNTQLKSDLGNASFKGRLINITANKNQQYNGEITLNSFEMGKFLKQTEQVGKLSLNAKINGTGIDPKTMNASVEGWIQEAEIKGYNYRDIAVVGSLANQIAQIKGNINDPNVSLAINTAFDISQEFPGIRGNVKINELNLKPLGLYSDNMTIKGDIDIDLPVSNPENPSGKVVINQGTLYNNGKPIPLNNVTLIAKNILNEKQIFMDAPFAKASLKGNFNYLQLSDIFINTIHRYFVIPDIVAQPITNPYNLKMDVKLVKHPVLQAFVPNLSRLDTTYFTANIDSQSGTVLNASLFMPFAEYDTIQINNVSFNMVGNNKSLTYKGQLDGINFDGFKVRKSTITGDVTNNSANFKATFKDSLNKDRHEIAGILQNIDNQYRINLNRRGLLVNYLPWQVDSSGYFQYGKTGLLAHQFLINRGEQLLSVHSPSGIPNSPLTIQTDSLDIKNFISLFSSDSTLAGGKIDGKILLSNFMESPSFTGDLGIKNFQFQKITIGDVAVNVFNETATKITTKASILGLNNDIQLAGNYYLNTKNSLDLNLIINKLGAETVEAFSFGQLRRAKGNLTGKAVIKGATSNPQIAGNLDFSKVAFDVSKLGSRYLIDQQQLFFEGQTIKLQKFTVSDTLNQPLRVDGNIVLKDAPSIKYDLTIDTQNFMVLNSTRKDNDLFYGKGFIDANLSLQGVSEKAKIEGDIKVREKSNISIIVPDSFDDLSESEGVVIFVNNKNNSQNTVKKDSLQEQRFTNDFISEISLNIEANDKSEFTIVVDEINGDNLKVKGNARLNAGVTADGQPYLLGSYDLTEGSYGLTFEVLKRQFAIQKGSNIIWTGDPMNADININAIYTVNAAPLDLMSNELSGNQNSFRQKMGFDVYLKMAGRLSKPDVSFEIKVAEKQSLVEKTVIKKVTEKLDTLNVENKNEINKQVFALLILNRFFTEKSADFFSNGSGGLNAEALARQSVSKLLSDQLDRFASDLIKGVDLDVNLTSSQDFFNGQSSTRTDLSLGLSKAFFNDKIEVKVGRNFELENTSKISRNPSEVFDNLTVNYKLTDDGRYLFKAFRKNQFQSVLEGFVVETGVGFTITMEYGKFKEVFSKKKNTKSNL